MTWHDGEPFTAADVIFTFEQIVTNPEGRAGGAASFIFTVDGEPRPVTFEALDDNRRYSRHLTLLNHNYDNCVRRRNVSSCTLLHLPALDLLAVPLNHMDSNVADE